MNLLRNFFRARLMARLASASRSDRRREWKVTVPAPRAPTASQ